MSSYIFYSLRELHSYFLSTHLLLYARFNYKILNLPNLPNKISNVNDIL